MARPVHVCIITTNHPLDDKRVSGKFAATFTKEGFRVSWVGPRQAQFAPERTEAGPIELRLVSARGGRLRRVVASRRIEPVGRRVECVDVYYAPDPDAAPIAVRLARKNGAKAIFDIHEIYHGALLDRYLMGMRLRPVRELIRRHIARTCARCDLVIGVSDAVLAPYVPQNVDRLIVRSCAPSCFASTADGGVRRPDRQTFTVMHGLSSLSRGTGTVLQALAIAAKQEPGLRVIMFERFGDDSDRDAFFEQVQALRVQEFVDMRQGVPFQQIPEILRACDLGIISYGRDLGADSLPNRLFEYMASGVPIVAPSYAREIAKIIDVERCGILVDFENPDEVARAILYLKENPDVCREMGQRARDAFLARHNWEVEVRPLVETIRNWFPRHRCA